MVRTRRAAKAAQRSPERPAAQPTPTPAPTADALLTITALLQTLQATLGGMGGASATPPQPVDPPAPGLGVAPSPAPTPAPKTAAKTDRTRTPARTDDDADDYKPPRRSPRFTQRLPFKVKKPFRGAPEEDVSIFLDTFDTQVRLAGLGEEAALLLLPTCLEDHASRWYHGEKSKNGHFLTYDDLCQALITKFTPTKAERRAHQQKLRSQRQGDNEPVLDFNHRFEALAAQCHMSDDDVRDVYVDALRPNLRQALSIRCPDTLQGAMRDAMSLDVSLARLQDGNPLAAVQVQVNQLASNLQGVARNARQEARPYPQRRKPCGKCGQVNHKTDRCGVRCDKCGRLGHLASECRSRQPEGGCTFCGRKNHNRETCFRDPNGPAYRPPKKGGQTQKTGN